MKQANSKNCGNKTTKGSASVKRGSSDCSNCGKK